MMPDKIYVNMDPFGFINGYCAEAHPPGCQEYIKKDALVEWAKLKRFEVPGEGEAYQRLLDEISSM